MAKQKKLIPCRVCGKMFEPCSYCQQHSDVFRWRNFACSIDCAKKYIASTEEYRAMQHEKAKIAIEENIEVEPIVEAKKRGRKKTGHPEEIIIETDEVVEAEEVTDDIPVVDDEPVAESESVVETVEDADGEVNDEIATDAGIEEV